MKKNSRSDDTPNSSENQRKITFWHPAIAFSPLEALISGIVLILVIIVMTVDRSSFDMVLLGMLIVTFILSMLSARAWNAIKKQSKSKSIEDNKEQKKKYPKRRKDYK